jgi:hypothetical protein
MRGPEGCQPAHWVVSPLIWRAQQRSGTERRSEQGPSRCPKAGPWPEHTTTRISAIRVNAWIAREPGHTVQTRPRHSPGRAVMQIKAKPLRRTQKLGRRVLRTRHVVRLHELAGPRGAPPPVIHWIIVLRRETVVGGCPVHRHRSRRIGRRPGIAIPRRDFRRGNETQHQSQGKRPRHWGLLHYLVWRSNHDPTSSPKQRHEHTVVGGPWPAAAWTIRSRPAEQNAGPQRVPWLTDALPSCSSWPRAGAPSRPCTPHARPPWP